jgi:phenylacetate-CoA ligase
MSISIWNRIEGSLVIAANLRGQRNVPFRKRDRIEEARDRRIRHMVEYAAKTVPYYRDLCAREKIDPREIRNAADLTRLPVLDRKLVRSHPRLFLSEAREARGALSFLTSGSTGTPVEICHDRHSLCANIPFGERERDPVIRACGSFRPKEVYIGYETSTFKKVTQFYNENTLMPVRPQRRFVSLQEPIAAIAAIINRERPDILVGYGGWIHLFFKTIAAHGIELHLPKMAIYMGEALPPGGRAFIEQRFGLPVLSRYNAVEAFKIGFFCEHRTGFHLHEDLCHLRIIGPDGRDCAPGIQGEIVISNLVNRASVLLNYAIGDMAAFMEGSCPCGRTLRLISELEGRVEDILQLADGSYVHPRSVWQVLKGNPDILQYQLIQEDRKRFELILATKDEAAFHRARTSALPGLQNLLGTDAVIAANCKTSFVCSPGVKYRAVVSRVKRDPGPNPV